MSRRCRGRNNADTDLIAKLMLVFIAIPILGIYWAFKGDTETKRTIGIVILIVLGIGAICSMFS